MNVISYSLFGYGKERRRDSFDFNSYLEGLMVNIRLARLLFPKWVVRLHLDQSTYNGFKYLFDNIGIQVVICEDALLTKAMLWRLKPMFDPTVERFICRDLDSPLMYRDAQAIKQWEDSGKAVHAISDSSSHNIEMLGGMVGFTKYAKDLINVGSWDELISKGRSYEIKGADQELLCKYVHPKISATSTQSILRHTWLGYTPPNATEDNFLTCGCRNSDIRSTHLDNCPLNIALDIPVEMKQSDQFGGHIGCAGYYLNVIKNFLSNYFDEFEDLRKAETPYNPTIFNWKI